MSDIEKQSPSTAGAELITEGPNLLGKIYHALDWIVIICMLIVAFVIDSFVIPFQRQFLLADITINYAFKTETVSDLELFLISALLPLIVIILCSILSPPHKRFLETYRGIMGLAESIIITLFLTNIFKVAVGELRPYFIAVCQPDLNLECTGDVAEIIEARKSFLSGHASISSSGLFYLSLFLIRVFRFRFSHLMNFESFKIAELNSNYRARFFLYAIIVAPTFGSSLIGLSRISDYYHQPHDVIFGFILGVSMAIAAFRLQFPSFFLISEPEKDSKK